MIMAFRKEVSLKCVLQLCPEQEFNIFPEEVQILE